MNEQNGCRVLVQVAGGVCGAKVTEIEGCRIRKDSTTTAESVGMITFTVSQALRKGKFQGVFFREHFLGVLVCF